MIEIVSLNQGNKMLFVFKPSNCVTKTIRCHWRRHFKWTNFLDAKMQNAHNSNASRDSSAKPILPIPSTATIVAPSTLLTLKLLIQQLYDRNFLPSHVTYCNHFSICNLWTRHVWRSVCLCMCQLFRERVCKAQENFHIYSDIVL